MTNLQEIQRKEKELKKEKLRILIEQRERKIQNLQVELENLKRKLEKISS